MEARGYTAELEQQLRIKRTLDTAQTVRSSQKKRQLAIAEGLGLTRTTAVVSQDDP